MVFSYSLDTSKVINVVDQRLDFGHHVQVDQNKGYVNSKKHQKFLLRGLQDFKYQIFSLNYFCEIFFLRNMCHLLHTEK